MTTYVEDQFRQSLLLFSVDVQVSISYLTGTFLLNEVLLSASEPTSSFGRCIVIFVSGFHVIGH